MPPQQSPQQLQAHTQEATGAKSEGKPKSKGGANAALIAGIATPLTAVIIGLGVYFLWCRQDDSSPSGGGSGGDDDPDSSSDSGDDKS